MNENQSEIQNEQSTILEKTPYTGARTSSEIVEPSSVPLNSVPLQHVVENPVETISSSESVNASSLPIENQASLTNETVNEEQNVEESLKETKKKKAKKKKQKDGGSGYGCASFLFLIILGLVAYVLFDKGIVTYDKETREFAFVGLKTLDEEEIVEKEEEEDNAQYYVSSDGRYFLMLGHENNYIQSSSENQPYFVFDIHDNDTQELATGGYQIRGNSIMLAFVSGCRASNGEFTCTLPAGVKVTNLAGTNMITLPYTEEHILLGNITLTNEKNLTES